MMARGPSLLLLSVTLASLAVGVASWWEGESTRAAWAWAAGTSPVLAVLCIEIVRSLAQGRFGLDGIAALAMAGCLAAGEMAAACVVALMFSGGQLLEAFAQGRAERDMTVLLARVPRSARIVEDGTILEIPMDAVMPGQRVLVRPGEVVPVDGVLLEAEALLDESTLTGESLPVRRAAGEEVVSGTTNAGGALVLTASRPASESTFARIVALVHGARTSRAPIARLADRWALGFLVLTIAMAGGAWLLTRDVSRALAVLVTATPCPLILAVPVALVAGLSRAARAGVLVKSAAALEKMAGARTLLLDKTGTLTTGQPTVAAITVTDGFEPGEVLRLAGSLGQGSQHVVSSALARQALSSGLRLTTPRDVREEHGAGVSGQVEGRAVRVGTAAHAAPAGAGAESCLAAGALAAHVSIDGRLAGVLTLADPVRPEAEGTLQALRRAGLDRIVLVTGDRDDVAQAVALGLPIDRVVAGVTPEGKVAVIGEERGGGLTAMVGDGVNDAPALAAADIGIAMGARGAAASSEVADVVVLEDSLARLPQAFSAARRSRRIAVQSVAIGMGLSLAAMIASGLGLLTPLRGALIQEAIDVLVVVNALRALRSGPV